jgi:methionine-rich copper-binding protein CopC
MHRSPVAARAARRTFRLALLGGVLATLLLPTAALAHAELDTVTPADKSTVEGSPTEIVMTFVQDLDPAKSSIRVVDASGSLVVQGGDVPAGKPREMDLAIATPLMPGAYTIRWTTTSTEDGETARGTTTFTVTAAAPSPTPTPSPTPAPSASSAAPSVVPSIAPSVAPLPSAAPTTPASSSGDAIVPIVAALLVLAGLGLWLLRGRSRAGR